MLNQATLEKMHAMKMSAMAEAFEHQLHSTNDDLEFDERLGMMIDAEWESRQQRRLTRRLQLAKLRYKASLEDIDFKTRRGLDRKLVIAPVAVETISDAHEAETP